MSKFKLNRRHVLRGMLAGSATAVGLPLMEAMLNNNGDALADGGALPCRFMTWFWGNGVRLDRFEPSIVGANWQSQPSEELQPFVTEGVADYINVCTGLRNPIPQQYWITHHEGTVVFNGYVFDYKGGLNSDAGGPTIDQVIADAIGNDTPVKSVHVGVSRKTSVMDQGTTMFALSHRGPLEPQYPEYDPQKVWAYLFGAFQPKPDDSALRLSVLDAVKEDINRLKGRLGQADINRLDAHLDGVAELEKKIQVAPPVCDLPMMPTETNPENSPNEPFDSVADAMDDLIAYAFACDITRVATNLFHGGAAETVWSNLGYVNSHHDNTHSSNNGTQNNQVHNGVVFLMTRLAKLAKRLRDQEEATGGNVLDSTIIYASSDCSEGYTHSVLRQPIILAGHGRNYLKYPGVHHQAAPFTNPNNAAGNTSDVLFTVLRAFDPTASQVGGGETASSTVLPDIMA